MINSTDVLGIAHPALSIVYSLLCFWSQTKTPPTPIWGRFPLPGLLKNLLDEDQTKPCLIKLPSSYRFSVSC